jgi:hypothetical protein
VADSATVDQMAAAHIASRYPITRGY